MGQAGAGEAVRGAVRPDHPRGRDSAVGAAGAGAQQEEEAAEEEVEVVERLCLTAEVRRLIRGAGAEPTRVTAARGARVEEGSPLGIVAEGEEDRVVEEDGVEAKVG